MLDVGVPLFQSEVAQVEVAQPLGLAPPPPVPEPSPQSDGLVL